MRWPSRHHRDSLVAMAWLRSIPMVTMALALACGGDDSTTAASTDATTSTTASESGESTAGSTSSMPTTALTTLADGTGGRRSAEGSSSGSDSGGSESGGVACDTQSCAADELCVLPCCGGPAPPCIDMPQGGCAPEDQEVPADQCSQPCATPMCCIDNCVPDPP